jgi:hypothetical protein
MKASAADNIRTIRRVFIALRDDAELPQQWLEAAIDAWDDFESEAGTAEGIENEIGAQAPASDVAEPVG